MRRLSFEPNIVRFPDAIQPVYRLSALRRGKHCAALRVRLRAKLRNVRVLRTIHSTQSWVFKSKTERQRRSGQRASPTHELSALPTALWLHRPAFSVFLHDSEHRRQIRDSDPAGLHTLPRSRRRAPVRPARVHGRRYAAWRGAERHDHALELQPVDLGRRQLIVDYALRGRIRSRSARAAGDFRLEGTIPALI